jgi:glucokinase
MELAAGIDLGGSSAKVGLVDREGILQARESIAIDPRSSFESMLAPVAACLGRLSAGIAGGRIAAVGVCSPGFIDCASGVVMGNCGNLPGLQGRSLTDYFHRATGVPAYADNDATVAAAGELLFGAGRSFRNFVMVTMGTGIGGGLVLDGRVCRGARGFAAEIGHQCVDPGGAWCICGSRGCLEQYASGSAIVRLHSEKLRKRSPARSFGQLTPKQIAEAAASGDPLALETIEEAAGFLARAFGSILNLLDLEACIVGGGISQAGETMLGPLRRRLADHCWPRVARGVRVIAAELLNDAGVLGAAAQAWERLES